ncbi:trans-4-hydroxy-L-proline dehydratase activase [Clostridium sp. HV4-5-A1G]|uniref:trans-4-hydroxy-L-proline dehydratase activase n=1 Tax=Clostridium sp. HV4-5-A1G TaxID=2004595 RepID=UPI001239A4B5|nr:trans-4-hydroxy-L-proline dehydratase activase [Clostridium sp. HV4-5-A1G]KAA8667421.1 glycyl-radical enzyme activating protein [Clostridium sp. HV4-5-A1G]CAB1262852.1 Trans-4-hydroxy-L-proline dehydratase activating enzyme [Clostridiaceae bacterium BL-3]
MTSGTIFNIQKYSIHDGPGIRTTVFFKGCPLKCWWCHNPESQNTNHEIMFFEERCTVCGKCIKKCPQNAIKINNNFPEIDKFKCTLCEKCVDFCPNNAREHVGRNITSNELIKEIVKDEVFYEQSGGGVTFSGGEPLMQVDFLDDILKRCKDRGIHTAVDTSGYAPWKSFERIASKVDLFLYDIKIMDNEKHKKYIGAENDIILKNIENLSNMGCNIYLRMPIIKEINDDNDHIEKTIKLLSIINVEQVNLLPYHKIGMDKYRRLKMNYKLSGMEKPSDERMEEISQKFKKAGIKIKIGG